MQCIPKQLRHIPLLLQYSGTGHQDTFLAWHLNIGQHNQSSCVITLERNHPNLMQHGPVFAHQIVLLRNSCPYTTYPTFSFPPMEDPISPLTNSSPHRTDTRTHPHSSPIPRASETRSVPIIDESSSSCFTFLVLICFALPPVLWSAGLHLYPRIFSSLDSAVAPHSLCSTGPLVHFPFLHRTILCLVFSLVQRSGSLP